MKSVFCICKHSHFIWQLNGQKKDVLCGLCPIDTAWKWKHVIYEQLFITIPLTVWELLPCSGRSPANANSDAYGQISCFEFIWAVYWCKQRRLFRALQHWSAFTWGANISEQTQPLTSSAKGVHLSCRVLPGRLWKIYQTAGSLTVFFLLCPYSPCNLREKHWCGDYKEGLLMKQKVLGPSKHSRSQSQG